MLEHAEAPTGPPGHPWRPVEDFGDGYLSVYFSERLARFPVRDITRPGDNKADPNIETGTYGLFSTCQPRLRRRIVEDGAATIFFVSTHRPGAGRVLTGYYHIGWYTPGTQGESNHDYALAADHVRFVEPVSVAGLPRSLSVCAGPFRLFKRLTASDTAALKDHCDHLVDRTGSYLREIARVERFARAQTGFGYPSMGRTSSFCWAEAKEYYQRDSSPVHVPNSSPSGRWRCTACDHVITNAALLKRCPVCSTTGTLRPELGGRP